MFKVLWLSQVSCHKTPLLTPNAAGTIARPNLKDGPGAIITLELDIGERGNVSQQPLGRSALAFAVLATRLESDHSSISYWSLLRLQVGVRGTRKHYRTSVRVILPPGVG